MRFLWGNAQRINLEINQIYWDMLQLDINKFRILNVKRHEHSSSHIPIVVEVMWIKNSNMSVHQSVKVSCCFLSIFQSMLSEGLEWFRNRPMTWSTLYVDSYDLT